MLGFCNQIAMRLDAPCKHAVRNTTNQFVITSGNQPPLKLRSAHRFADEICDLQIAGVRGEV